MHVTIFGALNALFNFNTKEREAERKKIAQEDHSYVRLNPADRAPCPGLNALANQGYLPRDGKNITMPRLEAALMEALHMSGAAAHAISQPLKPLLRKDGTFDLVDARVHNVAEHDRSLTRFDFRQGDNYTMQPKMLQAMLDDAEGGPMTVKSMAKTYLRRKREHKASGGDALPLRIWFANLIMTVSYINTEATGSPSPENVEQFWTEERFQDYILKNPAPRTLHGLVAKALLLLWHVTFG